MQPDRDTGRDTHTERDTHRDRQLEVLVPADELMLLVYRVVYSDLLIFKLVTVVNN